MKAPRVTSFVWLLLLLAPACGPRARHATAPPVAAPILVQGVYPAARSAAVFYDTAIWVQLVEPMDPASINERTVSLKVDTRYLPVTVSWDAGTRTIRLVPRFALDLRETYTVELSPELRTTSGQRLGTTYAWQFTTNSLRRPDHPFPPDGSAAESPLAPLAWQRTEASAGNVRYEVYAGTDSTLIATRAVTPAAAPVHPYLLTPASRAPATTYYWAVTPVNATTGERLEGPVRRFTTVPAWLPIDSVVVPAADWSWYRLDPNDPRNSRQFCMDNGFLSGPFATCAIRWRVKESAPALPLAGASLQLTMDINRNAVPSLWAAQDTWPVCGVGPNGPPYYETDGNVADGVTVSGTLRLRFSSNRLTSHLQGMARSDGFFGYVLRSNARQTYWSPTDTLASRRPELKLYYYRVP